MCFVNYLANAQTILDWPTDPVEAAAYEEHFRQQAILVAQHPEWAESLKPDLELEKLLLDRAVAEDLYRDLKREWGILAPIVNAWQKVTGAVDTVMTALDRNLVGTVYVAGAAAYAAHAVWPKLTENLRGYQGACKEGEFATEAGCEDPRAILFQCGDLPIWGDYQRQIFYCSEQPLSINHNDYTAEIKQLIANLDREASSPAAVASAVAATRRVKIDESGAKEQLRRLAEVKARRIALAAQTTATQGAQRVEQLTSEVDKLIKERSYATPDLSTAYTAQIGAARQEIEKVINQTTTQLNQRSAQLTAVAGEVAEQAAAIENRSDVALSRISASVPLVERRGGKVIIRRKGRQLQLRLSPKKKRRVIKKKRIIKLKKKRTIKKFNKKYARR